MPTLSNPKNSSLPPIEKELAQELLIRYKKRSHEYCKLRNTYYLRPIYEAAEINQKIKELERIIK